MIREYRQRILSAWEASVRALPIAAALPRPALVDHVPQILDRIAELTDAIRTGQTATLPLGLTERHAVERLHEGFGVAQVVAELALLRDCVLDVYEGRPQPPGELRAAMKAIDEIIASAVGDLVEARDRTLVALDRIATEPFESKTLDELLQRLLEVFVEATTAADTAVIVIREGDLLRVRASLGPGDEVRAGALLHDGEDFASRGVRTVHGVPLIADGQAIGVAHMGSRTENELPARDKRLFAALAARASAAIHHHMVKEDAERAAAELALVARDERFLARTAAVLASSVDAVTTFGHLARLAIPDMADWCVIDVLQDDSLDRVAVEHANPHKAVLAREWAARFPPDRHRPTTIDHVLRTGAPVLLRDITELRLEQSHTSATYVQMVRELGVRSAIVVPLSGRARTLGAISFMRASDPPYGERELATAVELGRRAGINLDNARLYSEAQDAIFSRDQMLAIVSHELRSPLASIELGATLARAIAAEEPRMYRHLEVIKRSAKEMARLLSDLLDTVNLQVDRFRIDRRREEIDPIVTQAIDDCYDRAMRKSIRVERDGDLAGVWMHCDRTRMLQALDNLIGNAIKFCKSGDVIFVKARRVYDQLVLLVEDTGPGIPERELSYVFDPYWSARRHAAKGTGLGLYITKGIIEAHGGTISVESRLGQGTTFTLSLAVSTL